MSETTKGPPMNDSFTYLRHLVSERENTAILSSDGPNRIIADRKLTLQDAADIAQCYENMPLVLKTLAEHEAEIERLRGIVDRLPRTADDVPVVPGMKLYVWNAEGEMRATKITGIAGDHPTYSAYTSPVISRSFSKDCYSTRAAAEAAREKTDDPA